MAHLGCLRGPRHLWLRGQRSAPPSVRAHFKNATTEKSPAAAQRGSVESGRGLVRSVSCVAGPAGSSPGRDRKVDLVRPVTDERAACPQQSGQINNLTRLCTIGKLKGGDEFERSELS